jgi:2-alkenal reductase
VVGINTLIVRGSGFGSDVAEGLGFAIPARTVQQIAGQIIDKGYYARPDLGIQWQLISPRVAAAYRLPVDWGVYVVDLVAGGPAAKAGLQQGDIITRIGDIQIDADHSYLNALFNYSPGQTTELEIARGTQILKVSVTFGESRSQQ